MSDLSDKEVCLQ